MKMTLKYLLVLVMLSRAGVYAQTNAKQQKADSALNQKLNSQLSQTQQMTAELRADSLRRAELEKQVARLSSAENVKKENLLKELKSLKQKDSLRLVSQKHQVDSLRKVVKGFPVTPFLDTLFNIYSRQGSFTAHERADAVSKRINKLSDDFTFSTDSLRLIPSEQTADVFYKNDLLISVSDRDGLWENTTKELLAARLQRLIGKAVVQYQRETSWTTLMKEGATALLVILIAALIIYALNRSFRWFIAKTSAKTAWYSRGIRIRNYELLNAAQEVSVLHTVISLIKWILILLIVYLALPVLFGIFPFTKDISTTLLSYIISPLKKIGISIWNYIPNLITIIVLVAVFRYVLIFFRYIKTEIERGKLTIPGFYADWASPTYQILRVLILAFMLIVIFPYMPGSDSQVFKGVSVFVGVLFTFGSAGALGNIVAGLVLTYMRAFKLGDRVKIGEVSGDVIGKTLLVTRIRTIQNEIISIPNSTVMNNHTVNYSSDASVNGLIVHSTVTIGYDAPWRQVHQLLIDAATATPMIEAEPKPYVLQTSLDDYYVSYCINAYTKEPNRQALIYSHLHANIQDYFNKAGVEIMSPHYKAIRDGNTTTIPADYLPKDYVAPVFNVKKDGN